MRYVVVSMVAGLLLSGCGNGIATEVRVETIKVPVPAPCPDKTTHAKLKGARPTPLRASPMPATAEERVAKTAAQLGKYETEGGWVDQVMAALDRCQQ